MTTRLRLAFFGDSICFGQLVSPHHSWVTRLAQRAEQIVSGIVVQNASVNGDQTRLALERMPKAIQEFRPTMLHVQFGMNDCNVWETDAGNPRVSPAAFGANLAEIIQRGRLFGAITIALHTNHPTTRDALLPNVRLTYQEQNAHYNMIIRDIAKAQDVALVDIEAAWFERIEARKCELADLLLSDGLHLSEPGHDLYFELVWPALEEELLAQQRASAAT